MMSITWTVLESHGMDNKLIEILRDINTNDQAMVRTCGMMGETLYVHPVLPTAQSLAVL